MTRGDRRNEIEQRRHLRHLALADHDHQQEDGADRQHHHQPDHGEDEFAGKHDGARLQRQRAGGHQHGRADILPGGSIDEIAGRAEFFCSTVPALMPATARMAAASIGKATAPAPSRASAG